MKLSRRIKLEYWQAVTTGMPHGNLEEMLTEALDKMEKELKEHKAPKSNSSRSQQQLGYHSLT